MNKPHIPILKAFDEFKFNLGKRALIEFLKGNENQTITKNNLDQLDSYGCLFMFEIGEIEEMIDQLIKHNFLQQQILKQGFRVIARTAKGLKEIYNKNFEIKVGNDRYKLKKLSETPISDEEKKLIENFEFFLKEYNDEQRRAIVSPKNNILCVAGAGSGKTTVLTKRAEFLVKFKSVKENDILAITFTRKAKEEMETRLKKLGIDSVRVETFNSFCEKLLRKYEDKIYDKKVRIATFKDKIQIVSKVMEKLNIKLENFADDYFNKRQMREKSRDELFFTFVHDIYSIVDSYKNRELEVEPFYEKETMAFKKQIAKNVYQICVKVSKVTKTLGLRDFSDQILEIVAFFENNKTLIPKFEHILVDEFQDVNMPQFKLLKLLNPNNTFAVGDPRQAIYGWRGSDITYILNFEEEFDNTQIIQLKKNYRSVAEIIGFANKSIKSLGLSDLEGIKDNTDDKHIFLVEHKTEILEKQFLLQSVKNSTNPPNEIFILARTNRILDSIADFFDTNGVEYVVKEEENFQAQKLKSSKARNNGEPKEPLEHRNSITLSTVHAIKGLEANEVYLVGCNNLSFPNKVADNFVFQLVKEGETYDKEAEELRLFYVAVSRAKEKLIISYTGTPSKFLNNDMLENLTKKNSEKSILEFSSKFNMEEKSGNQTLVKTMLKNWRAQKANQTGLPTYMIISNKAIDELAMYMPSSKEALGLINGLGDVKIAKYGDEIIRIINGG
jgi:superfamily I DNA/RNA helicase